MKSILFLAGFAAFLAILGLVDKYPTEAIYILAGFFIIITIGTMFYVLSDLFGN